MNLVEIYINEIISEEDIPVEETENHGLTGQYVRVTAVVNCYGNSETVRNVLREDEWTDIKKKGYYLA